MTEAQLRAFVAVADTGGFGPAGETLAMSQSGVSRAISALEAELGAPLFDRARGRTALTAFGERALVRARAMLTDADALRQEAGAARGAAAGRVRLGSMPSVTAGVLPALLARIRQRHPRLEVALLEGHDDELVDWVRDGTVDVAVVAGEPPGLVLQPLVTDDLLAAVPAAHELATAPDVRCEALAGEPFILTRAGCERIILGTLAAAGVAPRVAYEVAEAGTILSMVAEGLGVSVIPRLAARGAPDGCVLRELTPPATRELSLAVPAGREPAPAVRTFLAEAQA